MRRILALLLVAAGCGGGNAPAVVDAGPDAVPPLPRGHWSDPVQVTAALPAAYITGVSLTEDELMMCVAGGTLDSGMELFEGTRASIGGAWSFRYVGELNTVDDDTTPFVSSDGLTLWYSSDRVSHDFNTAMFTTTRAARTDPWTSPPSPLGTLNSPRPDDHFSVTPAQTTAFFASARDDGDTHIDMDVYLTTRADPTAAWGPARAVTGLETGEGESSPTISADALELYYFVAAPTTADCSGCPLLRVAVRATVDEPFTASEEVDELNRLASMGTVWLSPDGDTLYFTRYDLAANEWSVWMATR